MEYTTKWNQVTQLSKSRDAHNCHDPMELNEQMNKQSCVRNEDK